MPPAPEEHSTSRTIITLDFRDVEAVIIRQRKRPATPQDMAIMHYLMSTGYLPQVPAPVLLRWSHTALGTLAQEYLGLRSARGRHEELTYLLHPNNLLDDRNREFFQRRVIAVMQELAPRHWHISQSMVAAKLYMHVNTYYNYQKKHGLHHTQLLRLAFGG